MRLQIIKGKAKKDKADALDSSCVMKRKTVRLAQLLGPHESYLSVVSNDNEPVYGLRDSSILTLEAAQAYLRNKEIHVVPEKDNSYSVVRGVRYWQILKTVDKQGVLDRQISLDVLVAEDWSTADIYNAACSELLLESLLSGLTNGGQRILIETYGQMRKDPGAQKHVQHWLCESLTKKEFSAAIGVRYETQIEQMARERNAQPVKGQMYLFK